MMTVYNSFIDIFWTITYAITTLNIYTSWQGREHACHLFVAGRLQHLCHLIITCREHVCRVHVHYTSKTCLSPVYYRQWTCLSPAHYKKWTCLSDAHYRSLLNVHELNIDIHPRIIVQYLQTHCHLSYHGDPRLNMIPLQMTFYITVCIEQGRQTQHIDAQSILSTLVICKLGWKYYISQCYITESKILN